MRNPVIQTRQDGEGHQNPPGNRPFFGQSSPDTHRFSLWFAPCYKYPAIPANTNPVADKLTIEVCRNFKRCRWFAGETAAGKRWHLFFCLICRAFSDQLARHLAYMEKLESNIPKRLVRSGPGFASIVQAIGGTRQTTCQMSAVSEIRNSPETCDATAKT